MVSPRNHIKVFVASTVYNFQSELNSIYHLLDNFGYDVYNSHKGTFLIDSSESNQKNCINGVEDCDVFVGFIRPDYGSGVLEKDGKSITHIEFETAVKMNIPRFIMADYRVAFARSLIRKAAVINKNKTITVNSSNIDFGDKNIMDIRCVRLYEQMIKDKIPPIKRKGNWVQEYTTLDDIRLFLESQFKYPVRIKELMKKMKNIS